MQLIQKQSKTSAAFQRRALSVYGGAGGSGTCISMASSVLSYMDECDFSMVTNQKTTVQNLNNRLASYLEKVRSLQSDNKKLELQIREFYENRTPAVSNNHEGFFSTIAELRAEITRRYTENESVALQIDISKLEVENWKLKCDLEMNLRLKLEADVGQLRKLRDTLTLYHSDMELEIESMKERLLHMKRSHEEELQLLRAQQGGNVKVEVDSAKSVDLTEVMKEMRKKYEGLVLKVKQEVEDWYQDKMISVEKGITVVTTEVKEFNTQLSQLKRTYQSLGVELKSSYTEIDFLHQNVKESESRYSLQLSVLQLNINQLQKELQQLIASLQQQRTDYDLLLDIKMRLELEIEEYRRLLDGQLRQDVVVIQEVVNEPDPHIEKRVTVIVEKLVDGEVVSSSVTQNVEEVQ